MIVDITVQIKKKDKNSITAEIDVLITDVTKDELKKLTDGEYIK